ncbi:MAG: MarR family transcriptional regulator [Clostridiales Family XIII bacterium]|nr:MarR family transcriptional regulator [Clostridiales Family XIII bacterium]
MYLDSGTLTPVLKKLEAAGLVSRSRSAEDERILTVTPTVAGRKLRKRAVDIPAKMGTCISIAPEDAATLHQLLYRILGDWERTRL